MGAIVNGQEISGGFYHGIELFDTTIGEWQDLPLIGDVMTGSAQIMYLRDYYIIRLEKIYMATHRNVQGNVSLDTDLCTIRPECSDFKNVTRSFNVSDAGVYTPLIDLTIVDDKIHIVHSYGSQPTSKTTSTFGPTVLRFSRNGDDI